MVGKDTEWESELWSYVSSGDDVRCPVHSHCRFRKRGGWCPDDNAEYLKRLIDDVQFSFSNFDSIEYGARWLCKYSQRLNLNRKDGGYDEEVCYN